MEKGIEDRVATVDWADISVLSRLRSGRRHTVGVIFHDAK
jgi:hypothetical protein